MSTNDVILVAIVVMVPTALLWAIFLVRRGRPGQPARPRIGIPRALRPGQPDEVLEGKRLERILTWGFIVTLALAIFIPAYWLPETQRQTAYQDKLNEASVERGSIIFKPPGVLPPNADPLQFKKVEKSLSLGMGCANCHGAGGAGGQNVFTDPVTGSKVVYKVPPLNNVFQRWDEDTVRFTIEQGRPGTDMPTWGVLYGGPMTEMMINDVIAYLHSLPGNQPGAAPPLPSSCSHLPKTSLTPSPSPSSSGGGGAAAKANKPKPAASTGPFGEGKPKQAKVSPQVLDCGKGIFMARCAVCHGPEGQGKQDSTLVALPGTGVPGIPLQKGPVWYQGMALWHGNVQHLTESEHFFTIVNGRRFAFMPPWGESPAQGIPVPPNPLSDDQINAVMQYERTL
ncbi:MAG TPA: c-type cytochrome [Actinomycetota bacterium]|nr:c-type cytochrome [Actinomycetota bacterium]